MWSLSDVVAAGCKSVLLTADHVELYNYSNLNLRD